MKVRDLRWVLAYPFYQLVGTARHEFGHALIAWVQGYSIEKFVFWPTWEGGHIRWGYVIWKGSASAIVLFGPYLLDLLTFFVALLVLRRAHVRRRWLWLNIVILGMLSPLINSLYNYQGGLTGGSNDVGRLLDLWPAGLVHGYFLLTLGLYLLGVVSCFRRAAQRAGGEAQPDRPFS